MYCVKGLYWRRNWYFHCSPANVPKLEFEPELSATADAQQVYVQLLSRRITSFACFLTVFFTCLYYLLSSLYYLFSVLVLKHDLCIYMACGRFCGWNITFSWKDMKKSLWFSPWMLLLYHNPWCKRIHKRLEEDPSASTNTTIVFYLDDNRLPILSQLVITSHFM